MLKPCSVQIHKLSIPDRSSTDTYFNHNTRNVSSASSTAATRQQFPIHVKEKKFRCDVCSKQFTRKWSFLKHMELHEKMLKRPGGGRLRCVDCNRTFANKHSLGDHMSHTHTQIESLLCTLCNARMQRKKTLWLDLRAHANGNAFQCDICDARFTHKNALYAHTQIHLAKTFICNVCKANFCTKNQLKSHHVTHTNARGS